MYLSGYWNTYFEQSHRHRGKTSIVSVQPTVPYFETANHYSAFLVLSKTITSTG